MKILIRYILKESAVYFAVSLFVFTGMLLTGKLIRLTSLIINKGVDIGQIAMLFVAIVPTFLEFAIPMSVLLGIMLAFARLSGDSEIVVIRASGVSLYQLMQAVVWAGLISTAIGFYVSLVLRPWGNREMARVVFEIARTKSTAGLEAGLFNKLGHLIIYAEEIDALSGNLKHVMIDDKRNRQRRQIIIAKTGLIESNAQTQTITLHLQNGSIHEVRDANYAVTDFTTNHLLLHSDEIYNPDAKKDDKRRGEMSLSELDAQVKSYQEMLKRQHIRDEIGTAWEPIEASSLHPSDFSLPTASHLLPSPVPVSETKIFRSESVRLQREINRFRIERVRRFSMPVASLFLALMAMPLGIQPPRAQKSWGITISVCLGILVFLTYYGLLTLGIILSEAGKISPHLGLWLPNLVVATAAVYTLQKMASEKWQSILHGFEELIDYLFVKMHLRLS